MNWIVVRAILIKLNKVDWDAVFRPCGSSAHFVEVRVLFEDGKVHKEIFGKIFLLNYYMSIKFYFTI